MSRLTLTLRDGASLGEEGAAVVPLAAAAPIAVDGALRARVEKACGRIAPLWPLQYFVAVNPFLGLADQPFETARATLSRVGGAALLMPRSFFAEQIAAGRITDADLAQAIAARGAGVTVAELKAAAQEPARAAPAAMVTFVEVADRASGSRWAPLAADEIAKWCAAWFDQGQAAWRMPWQSGALYAAWREAASIDRTPEAMGLAGFRAAVGRLPQDPLGAIAEALTRLGLANQAADDYLHRALSSVGGWAAYARQRSWQAELYGSTDAALQQLLAIRVAWDLIVFELTATPAARNAWREAVAAMTRPAADEIGVEELLLQEAYEAGFQRELAKRLAAPRSEAAAHARADLQAAFCIDVRSEIFRRALESTGGRIETIGFAGFFGYPIEYVPLGHQHGGAQCPVLLTPKFRIRETVQGASPTAERAILDRRLMRRRVRNAWKAFKTSAVSCFPFVETAGLLFAGKLVSDTLGLTRPVAHPAAEGLDEDVLRRAGPRLDPEVGPAGATGIAPDQRVDTAEAALRGMSLTDGFARLVLVCGHGSTTVNNPHASGLDCGACGGHTGEANARVAAGILNDPAVRTGLAERGIAIPQDTWFVAGLHDTTTDEVALYDLDAAPASHAADLERLRSWLGQAARLARAERAKLLHSDGDREILQRSRDWSQVRPEWGLAGNAAFIAAPRSRTRGVDLGGRAFLHTYDWRQDSDGAVLELIMTAPMVVASWINLQYYGSTVDNRAFGCGNKTLHNVVGTLGVLEGNGGDLRTGLPLQSLHDGNRFVHEPLRLNVLIEAPQEAIDSVIAKHASVRQLLDHAWLHLLRIGEDGKALHRRMPGGRWQPCG